MGWKRMTGTLLSVNWSQTKHSFFHCWPITTNHRRSFSTHQTRKHTHTKPRLSPIPQRSLSVFPIIYSFFPDEYFFSSQSRSASNLIGAFLSPWLIGLNHHPFVFRSSPPCCFTSALPSRFVLSFLFWFTRSLPIPPCTLYFLFSLWGALNVLRYHYFCRNEVSPESKALLCVSTSYLYLIYLFYRYMNQQHCHYR